MSAADDKDNEACELCGSPGGELLWEDGLCRVVRVAEPDYPGFCRVILQRHLREMTDLPHAERMQLMRVVFAVETALRRLYRPDKINLASFGNMVPHVHWHVIPRWCGDRHFPEPIWGRVQREAAPTVPAVDDAALIQALAQALGASTMDDPS